LVTDVGLHTGKITREESIQYMMEKEEENNKLQFQKQKIYGQAGPSTFL
jgi:uncharacterized protein (DUF885 family)